MVLVENDEINPVLVEKPSDELGAEARETVFVGHHNLLDQSLHDVLQKPG